MYAITGAFGQTGTALCNALMKAGQPVRLIARREGAHAVAWRAKGATVVVLDVCDTPRLTEAFVGVAGAYLLNPPAYMECDLFLRARDVHRSMIAAAMAAAVPHVVALSSVGAHLAHGTGNIQTTWDFEQQLLAYKGKLSVLRAANFMENWAWALAPVREQGMLPSMFLPVGRALPMVSSLDIGQVAADLLLTPASSNRIVELHGPQDGSPEDAAAALSALLDKPVTAVPVEPQAWPGVFRATGFPETTIQAFCAMYQGFNDGTVAFEGGHETRRGRTTLRQALAKLLSDHEDRQKSPHA